MTEVNHLTVRYPDGTKALDDISFRIADGESVALVGANGAGKTSLLLTLVGVLPAAAGSIRINGTVLNQNTLREIRRQAGLVFQNPDDQLFMPLLCDDIAFGPRNYGMAEDEVAARVDQVLRRLGIWHLRDRSSLRLSGGEKRVAALATVLAMEPSLMLFDEPTAFLDPKARRRLIELLRQLPHEKLIATHDLTFARAVCSRVILLRAGRLFADGPPDDLLYDQALMDRCEVEAIGADCADTCPLLMERNQKGSVS